MSILITFFLFLLTSCGNEIYSLNNNKSFLANDLIEGQVNPMIGLVTSKTSRWYDSIYAFAGVCTAEVSIYRLSISGQKVLPAIATTTVDSSAKFKFENLNLKIDENYSDYILEVVGEGGGPCDVVYQRPLLGKLNQQDVTYSSTLLSFTLIADLPKKIHQVSSPEIEKLMNDLSGGSLDSAFGQLITNQDLRDQFFSLFGGNPEKLVEIPPTIRSETIPSILSEEVIHQFSISALHWSASYNIIVKWKLDGTTIQTTPIDTNFLYAPGMNESGTHTLQAFIGKNDGLGELDPAFSYQVKSYNLLVNNNSLPILPTFTLPSSITSSSSVIATIQTGVDMINCKSFSTFAFTVDDSSTPAANLIAGPCTDSLNQNVTISLGADGTHQIRLWVKDRSNLIISSNPLMIVKDSTYPQTQLASNKLIYTSGETIALTFSATDNIGLSTLELFKSEDGGTTYTKVTDLNLTDTSYSLSAPSLNVSNFKLKLKASDGAGLSHESVITLLIDVDAPTAPIISLVSPALTNSLSAQFTVATCSDVDKILIKESSTTPLKTDPSWQNCSTSVGSILHTLSLGESVKTIYAFAVDAAGNISLASNLISVTLDQTAPAVPNLSNYPYNAFNSNSLQFTAPNCTDISHVLISESSSSPALLNPAWQSCSIVSGALTHTLSSNLEGNYSLYAWVKDLAGNISSVKNLNIAVDKTAPVISSLKINDDDVYTGTSFVSLKVNASDNLTSMKMHFVEANINTGDCNSEYSQNNEWYDWNSSTQEFSFSLSNMDGVKKVCAWAKDAANNTTALSHSDDIQFFVANPPKIIAFNIYNPSDNSRVYTNGNNSLNIDWSITSTLDLATNPISMAYTTNGSTYKDIITNQDITNNSQMTWLGNIGTGLKAATGIYTSFPAPTSFFRIKIFVKDASGNIGIPVISDIQNSDNWSVYAGTEDRGGGGAGKSALLKGGVANTPLIAIHPTTNDIYAYDVPAGIKKLDARTGLVSIYITHSGTNNLLTNNGFLPTTPSASLSSPVMYFDKDGYLYLTLKSAELTNSLNIYQINPSNRAIKLYLAGGTDIGSGSTPPNFSQMNIARLLGLDDENSLYIVQNCLPGSQLEINVGHRKIKIVKVLQNNSTKQAQEAVNVAGNCGSSLTPSNGSIATESPLPAMNYVDYINVIAWGGGKYVYLFDYNSNYKIIENKFYTATTLTKVVSGLHNPSTGNVFAARSDLGIAEIIPNLNGANGDTVTSLSGSSANGCSEDDIPITSACPTSWSPPVKNAQGKIFFTDGNYVNTGSTYRIRYISSDQKIKTIFGTKPLYGEGLTANLARGQLGGIYYKKASEPAQDSFPEGLYFVDLTGPAFGYINPTSKITSILWGDQSFRTATASGTLVSNQTSMGQPYAYINGQLLTFDSNGFPWLGHTRGIHSLNASLINTTRINATGSRYETRPDDSLITSTGNYVDGFQNNLQISSTGLGFTLGAYDHPVVPTKPVLKALNFGSAPDGEILAGTIKHVMGNTTLAGVSADSSIDPTPVTSKTLSSSCLRGGCSTYYDEVNIRIYFLEGTKIRYINNANSPSINTLHTLIDTTRTISNFTFSQDLSTLYYTSGGYLYCLNVTSTRSECNVGAARLGPPTGAAGLNKGPNQFTWKDSTTLLISNYGGIVYQYKLP